MAICGPGSKPKRASANVSKPIVEKMAIERSEAPNSISNCFGFGVSARIFRPASGLARITQSVSQTATAKTM